MRRILSQCIVTACCLIFSLSELKLEAAILTTGFFSGTIERFDAQGSPGTTFAAVASMADPFPGLSGIAVNPLNNQVFASARISNRIYSFDGTTGALLGFHQLSQTASPAGLVFSSNGTLYVSNFGANTVESYNVANNSAFSLVNTLSIPNSLPNGLAFDATGRLLISTFSGLGVLASDASLGSTSTFASAPNATGQIAVDSLGNVYVGSAAVSSNVFKFDATGTQIGNPFLTVSLPDPALPYASPNVTSPSGVAIDGDGNLIVAALGQTNPTSAGDNFQSNGGLLKYSTAGSFIGPAFATGSTPFSSVAVISAVPEPTSLLLLATAWCTGNGFRRRRRLSTPR